MHSRFRTPALSILLTCLAWPGVVLGQTTSSVSQPRTPWGDPDLQGYYTNKYRVRHSVRAADGVCRQAGD